MCRSKNTLNTTLKMGRLDKMIIFRVLIIVTILICVSLDVPFRERRRSIFLEGVFGLIHMGQSKNTLKKNGPSQFLSQHNKKVANQYHNNKQHNEYNYFIKTAYFLPNCSKGIFGLTHMKMVRRVPSRS